MKRTAASVLGVLVVMMVACAQLSVSGSGNVVTREESYSGFDKVDVSQGFKVEINQGDELTLSSGLMIILMNIFEWA